MDRWGPLRTARIQWRVDQAWTKAWLGLAPPPGPVRSRVPLCSGLWRPGSRSARRYGKAGRLANGSTRASTRVAKKSPTIRAGRPSTGLTDGHGGHLWTGHGTRALGQNQAVSPGSGGATSPATASPARGTRGGVGPAVPGRPLRSPAAEDRSAEDVRCRRRVKTGSCD